MTESDIQNAIRLKLSKANHVNFRVNVGKVRMGDGRYFDTGLPKGFSDLFGVKTVTITPEMVGQKIGQAVFLEVKTPTGKVRPEQVLFLENMKKRGCVAEVIRGVDDLCNFGLS